MGEKEIQEQNYKNQTHLIRYLAVRETKKILGDLKKLDAGEYSAGKAESLFSDYYDKLGNVQKMIRNLASEKKEAVREYSTLENVVNGVVGSILVIGGIGVFSSLFARSKVINEAVQSTQQLAPPMPDYLPFVFLAMYIGGLVYFLAKKFKKKFK